MSRYAFISALAAALVGFSPAIADPPPASPIYLLSLPERQWAFAELLWQGQAPCKPELCEAGYHAGNLVLSVMQGRDYVQAVAGIKNCQTVSYRVVKPDEIRGLSIDKRIALVRSLAEGVARVALQSCAASIAEEIDTKPLVRLVMPPQSLAK